MTSEKVLAACVSGCSVRCARISRRRRSVRIFDFVLVKQVKWVLVCAHTSRLALLV
jgi:hypothetical protein